MANALKDTLEKLLGRPLATDADEALMSKRSPEGVPFALQPDPFVTEQLDDKQFDERQKENADSEEQPERAPAAEETSEPEMSDENRDAAQRAAIDKLQSDSETDDQVKAIGDAQTEQFDPDELNFGSAEDNKSKFGEALQAQKDELRRARMERYADMLTAGIAGIKPSMTEEEYQNRIKNSNIPIQQYEMEQKSLDNDPESGMSKGLRDYMKKLGINVADGATASQIKQVLPMAFKDIQAQQAAASKSADLQAKLGERRDEAKWKADMLRATRDKTADAKQSAEKAKTAKQDTERFDRMNKLITSEVASSRSAFGQAARNAQSIENAKALLNGSLDYNDLDTRQIYELSKTLDRVLSQGGSTISGTEHLNPDTARARVAKQLEFIGNKRQGAHAGDFVKTIAHTLDREQEVAAKQISSGQAKLLSSFKDLQEKYPDRFNEILAAQGIDPEALDYSKKKEDTEDSHSQKQGSDSEMIKVKDPKGKIRAIPKSQLNDALAAGGELVK